MSQPTIKRKAKESEIRIHQAAAAGDGLAIHCTIAKTEVMGVVLPEGFPKQAEFIGSPSPHGPATSFVMIAFAVLMLRDETQADAVARLRSTASGAGSAWRPQPEGKLREWLETGLEGPVAT